MPGIDLAGERRLLLLWLALAVVFSLAYYVWPTPPLLQRFERVYHQAYWWSRPVSRVYDDVHGGEVDIGWVTPRYISSLLDAELWITVHNPSTTNTITPTIIVDHTTTIEWVESTKNGEQQDRSEEEDIEALVLLREGEADESNERDSRRALEFGPIKPHDTVTRFAWVRIMPLASQGNQTVHLFDDDIKEGYIQFQFRPLDEENKLGKSMSLLLDENKDSRTYINSQKTLERAFVRTLLLPPWANGLLIVLALVIALVANSMVGLFEERFEERKREREKEGKKGNGSNE